jgi:hypothetical protein
MRYNRSEIIEYFLQLFSLPRVKEEIAKYARAFLGEASRFTTGVKGEAVETKEAFIIFTKYLKKEKLTRTEKKQFKIQMVDMLKSVGVVVPVMLIPLPFVSTILLILMDHLLQSMNIQILPQSFYPQEKNELLTKEAIEAELQKGKAQNQLEDNNISRVVDAYDGEADIDKFMRVVGMAEIKENDFNLNISRYIDTNEAEEEIDLKVVLKAIAEIEDKEKAIDEKLNQYLKELGL